MKIQITSFLVCSFIAVFSLMSHHNGVAEEQNKDRTGAPGSAQPCTHCHSPAGNVNTTSTINVYDANGVAVSEYIPGTDYEVEFKVVSDGALAYGFQATSILADGSNAGSFSSPGTNVQLEDVNGRHIVEQSDPLASGVFTATWNAPATGAGDVAFYMAGLGVNLAYGNNGDNHHATAFSLTEGINDGIEELAISLPLVNGKQLSWRAHENGVLNIYSLGGSLTSTVNCSAGATAIIDGLDSGLLLAQFVPNNTEDFTPLTWKLVIND